MKSYREGISCIYEKYSTHAHRTHKTPLTPSTHGCAQNIYKNPPLGFHFF